MWYLITALAPAIWGTTYVWMEWGLANDLPFWNALFRALPAGLLLLLIKPQGLTLKTWRYGTLIGTLNIGIFFVCLFVATSRVPGSVVATLGATMPIQVMVLRAILFRSFPSIWQAIAGVIGVIGVHFLVSGASESLDMFGIAIAVVGIFSMALATVLMQHHGMTENVVGFMGIQLIAGAICILPFAYVIEGALPAYNAKETFTLGWLSIVNTGLGYLLWLYGLRKVGVLNASLMTLINPVVAVVLGVLVMQNPLSHIQLIAISIILFSVALPTLVTLINKCPIFQKVKVGHHSI